MKDKCWRRFKELNQMHAYTHAHTYVPLLKTKIGIRSGLGVWCFVGYGSCTAHDI